MKPIRATDVKALSAQCMLAGDVHGHIDQLARNPAIKASVKNAVYLELSKAFARKGDKFTAIHFASLPLQQGQSSSDKQHLAAIRQLMALGQHEQALRYQIARHLNALNGRNSDTETKTALLKTFRAWDTAAFSVPRTTDTSGPTDANAQHQCLSAKKTTGMASATASAKADSSSLKVIQLAAINLGQAWSSNTINTVIFRHHGILTWGGYQYTSFYVNETTLRVVRRALATNHIATHDIAGQYNLRDAHNSISLGIDRAGYLHISYDHHATKLRYRRSSQPNAIAEWTDELAMTGANEDQLTYPTFILPRAGHPLTMLYRDGVHNKGSARLKTYDEQTQSWTDRPTPVLSGADQKPWTSNAYWNHPAIGSDGSLHLSFVWRTDTIGEQQLVNNVNIGYAWSPDNGLSWFTSRGLPCKLPMTQVNAETVWPVSHGSNLINQTSMALDSHNRPHIAFYANDTHGVPQYQHIWFDGEAWHQQYFSARTQPFTLQGGGTLQIPISRPEILIDHQDRVYAVYRGDQTENRMAVTQLMGDTANPEAAGVPTLTTQLWPTPVDYAEPVIDRTRWAESQVLSLLLQRTQQPNGDLSHQHTTSPVWLVDFSFSF